MAIINRFGYEWSTYPDIVPLYEHQFRGWICPLEPADFKGMSVLDAGCGTGRNSMWPLKYGAREVVAIDVDPRTVAVAARNLAAQPNAVVLERSIYDIGYPDRFDIAFSIGVIHHLERPRDAVAQLVQATRPGGRILIWVYGREGHTWLKTTINLIRRITCRMPLPVLSVLLYPVSFLWYLYLKCMPHRHPYLQLLRPATFWHVHSILFDQLLPEIAHYWTRAEALDLFRGLQVTDVQSYHCNAGSWTIIARKCAPAEKKTAER